MTERILFVDDEPHVLAGLRRNLRRRFKVETAEGPEVAIDLLRTQGPFAVVVSDYRMPGMNGVQFLTAAADIDPDCVRMMLTGHADMDVAIEAVNQGRIFRFLRKPCPTDLLTRVLQDALRHRKLVDAEKELLEGTLQGTLKVLSQTLSLTNPAAFGLGARIEPMVNHVVDRLGLPDAWQYKVAAMVSQIGCVTLPPDLVEKVYALGDLTEDEVEMFAGHAQVGAELLAHVPRLEAIAEMIRHQDDAPPLVRPAAETAHTEPGRVGAQLLRVAIAFDKVLHTGKTQKIALHRLRHEEATFTPELVEALEDLHFVEELGPAREVTLSDMLEGMILEEDVRTGGGLLLMARGHEVTYAVLQRLRRLADRGESPGPFRVRIRRTVARQSRANQAVPEEARP